jgi:hypothetical protein
VPDNDLRGLLPTLTPNARDALRRVLIHDQADRDAIASRPMRYRDQNGPDWADIHRFQIQHDNPWHRRFANRSISNPGYAALR